MTLYFHRLGIYSHGGLGGFLSGVMDNYDKGLGSPFNSSIFSLELYYTKSNQKSIIKLCIARVNY